MAPHRILLIDDDPHLPVIIRLLLAKTHSEVMLYTAREGQNGVAMAESVSPHLILLDCRMPGWDGFETLTQLRANPHTAHIPIVTISGAIPTRGRCAEMIARSEAYLSKPLDLSQLLAVITQFINFIPDNYDGPAH